MRTSTPRKFTLVDAMVLVAAVGVGFVLIRGYLDYLNSRYYRLPDQFTLISLWRYGTFLSRILAPLATSLSLGLWLLRMRKPRPDLRHALRQPGMIACAAAVLGTSLFLVKVLLNKCFLYLSDSGYQQLHDLWLFRLPLNGEIVAVSWILLWISGSWRSEPSWIDRAGRALGVYWIVSGLFFDLLFRY
jgi:hypothetical protein